MVWMFNPGPGERGFIRAIPKSPPPLAVRRGDLTQKLEFIEAFACSFRHRAERIFSNMDRQTRLFAQKLVETAQQRAAAREHKSSIDKIGRKFRRTTLQRDAH